MAKIKVLLVDDSAVVRQVNRQTLEKDPDIEVIAAVQDPLFAIERMKLVWPDVIVTDIEMPRMDGLTFVRKIMAERPTPFVICSSLAERGAEITMEALAAGAVGVITKPKIGVKEFLQDSASGLIGAVKDAACANMGKLMSSRAAARPAPAMPPSALRPKLSVDVILPALSARETTAMTMTTERIVAMGTSTGGTQALERVLRQLPQVSPGIVVVQHMPEKFTAMFADRLNNLCAIEIREAKNGDRVHSGLALIAPGGKHMMLKRSGAQYQVEVIDGPLVNRHRPSVDVLFRSAARSAGRNAYGIIMTGMGDDGARGLKEMHEAGAYTVAQDEESCVVFGMPKEAIKLGGVDKIVSLDAIPGIILSAARS
ncbi:MAG: chemotaxis response regulator protein-glutamate methylesterase [Pseudomonadota bacterium]